MLIHKAIAGTHPTYPTTCIGIPLRHGISLGNVELSTPSSRQRIEILNKNSLKIYLHPWENRDMRQDFPVNPRFQTIFWLRF
jgi:hypothetical protein